MKLRQLTLRDLFWLICALALGWWLELDSLRSKLKTVQEQAAKSKGDADRLAKQLLSLPPTGANYDLSAFPLILTR